MDLECINVTSLAYCQIISWVSAVIIWKMSGTVVRHQRKAALTSRVFAQFDWTQSQVFSYHLKGVNCARSWILECCELGVLSCHKNETPWDLSKIMRCGVLKKTEPFPAWAPPPPCSWLSRRRRDFFLVFWPKVLPPIPLFVASREQGIRGGILWSVQELNFDLSQI